MRQGRRGRGREKTTVDAAVDRENENHRFKNSPAPRFSPSLSGGSIKSARPAAACCAGAETKVEKEERPDEDASKERAMRLASDDDGDEEEQVAASLSKVRLERSAWPVSRARRRSIRRAKSERV